MHTLWANWRVRGSECRQSLHVGGSPGEGSVFAFLPDPTWDEGETGKKITWSQYKVLDPEGHLRPLSWGSKIPGFPGSSMMWRAGRVAIEVCGLGPSFEGFIEGFPRERQDRLGVCQQREGAVSAESCWLPESTLEVSGAASGNPT